MSNLLSLTKRIALSMLALLVLSAGIANAPAFAETHTVKMGSDNYRLVYVPEQLTIQPGDIVKWVNNAVPPHNAVFEPDGIPTQDDELADELTKSDYLYAVGDSYETEFPEDAPAGDYHYYCIPHQASGMRGVITVEAPDP